MEAEKLTWDKIEEMCGKLAEQVKRSEFKPEILIGISRGGWIPARILSDMLGVYRLASIGVVFYKSAGKTMNRPKLTQELNVDIRGKRVLLIDDVADTGESLLLAKEKILALKPLGLKVATLNYKPKSKVKPDFFVEETTSWLVYPWEKREFEQKG